MKAGFEGADGPRSRPGEPSCSTIPHSGILRLGSPYKGLRATKAGARKGRPSLRAYLPTCFGAFVPLLRMKDFQTNPSDKVPNYHITRLPNRATTTCSVSAPPTPQGEQRTCQFRPISSRRFISWRTLCRAKKILRHHDRKNATFCARPRNLSPFVATWRSLPASLVAGGCVPPWRRALRCSIVFPPSKGVGGWPSLRAYVPVCLRASVGP